MARRWNRMGGELSEQQRQIVRMRQRGYRKATIQARLGVRSTTVDYTLYKAVALGYKVNLRDREVNTRPGGDCYRIAGTRGGYWRQVIGGTEEDARRQWASLGGEISEAGPL